MAPPVAESLPPGPPSSLGPEERRWLHDKYERLAEMEGNLLAGRTSYFATICAVLITGLVFALVNLLGEPVLLTVSVVFLAAIGIVLSLVWEILVHRTTGAQRLWREAALRLEEQAPPLEGTLRGTVGARGARSVEVDLLRPYHAHLSRFGHGPEASWAERINPATVSEVLPISFVAIWTVVLLVMLVWLALYA